MSIPSETWLTLMDLGITSILAKKAREAITGGDEDSNRKATIAATAALASGSGGGIVGSTGTPSGQLGGMYGYSSLNRFNNVSSFMNSYYSRMPQFYQGGSAVNDILARSYLHDTGDGFGLSSFGGYSTSSTPLGETAFGQMLSQFAGYAFRSAASVPFGSFAPIASRAVSYAFSHAEDQTYSDWGKITSVVESVATFFMAAFDTIAAFIENPSIIFQSYPTAYTGWAVNPYAMSSFYSQSYSESFFGTGVSEGTSMFSGPDGETSDGNSNSDSSGAGVGVSDGATGSGDTAGTDSGNSGVW